VSLTYPLAHFEGFAEAQKFSLALKSLDQAPVVSVINQLAIFQSWDLG